MTDSQKVATAIVRLVALYVVVRGVLGILGIFFFAGMAAGFGMMGMATNAVLLTIAVGVALFFAAPVIGKLAAFDL